MDYVTPGTFVDLSGPPYVSAATMNAFDDGIVEGITKAEQALASVSGVPAVVQIDSFSGANDAAKMSAALTYGNAQTYKPWLQLPSRTFDTGSASFDMYQGMKILGPGVANAPKNQEIANSTQTGTWRSTCGTGANSLLRASTTIQSVAVCNVSFWLPSQTSQVFRASGGSGAYPSVFHNLSMYGGPYFFGNPSEKFLTTQMVLSGHWQLTVDIDTPFTFGGSDCSFWMSGYCNADSGPGNGAGKPVITFDSVGKSNVGFLYMTNRADWTGVKIVGDSTRELSFFGGAYEGYSTGNATRPVFDIQGGTVNLYGIYTGQVASTGSANGVIHQSGGQLNVYGGTYLRDEAVATFPWLYQTAGTAKFYGIPQCAAGAAEQLRVRWSDGSTTTFPAHANPTSVGAAATDAASTMTLANNLRTALINAGIAI